MGFHRSVRFLYNCCCCWLLLLLVANNVVVVVVVTCASSSSSSSTTPLSNTIRVIDEFKNRFQLLIRQQHQYQANDDDDDKTVTSLFSSYDGGSIYYGIPRTILDSNFQRHRHRRRGDSSSSSSSNIHENDDDEKQHNNDIIKRQQQQYYEEYETIGKDVEKWALEMIREETTTTTKTNNNSNNNNNDNENINDNGWKEIYCSKAFRHKFNTNYHNHNHNNNNNNTSSIPPRITTRQYIKWIPDSRDPKHQGVNVNVNTKNNNNDSNKNQNQNQKYVQQLHPCMKLIATIHAPYPIVCRYLSDRNNFQDYNSLLIEQKDIKIINSYSKICWSQSKKLLFIQPRDFVTYCRHRWLNNGRVQFITNQACEHISSSDDDDDSDDDNDDAATPTSSKYRAYSLRGATLISPCSSTLQDNNKEQEQEQEQEQEEEEEKIECTTIIMLSHCNCGNDIPEWAVRTAVGILAPIKPFEIIHRIEIGIQKSRYELEKAEKESSIKMKLSSSSSNLVEASTSSSSLWSSDDDDERGKKRIITRRRSSRPAGIAQMGYGAFWPDGGGLLEEENDDMEENLYFDETI